MSLLDKKLGNTLFLLTTAGMAMNCGKDDDGKSINVEELCTDHARHYEECFTYEYDGYEVSVEVDENACIEGLKAVSGDCKKAYQAYLECELETDCETLRNTEACDKEVENFFNVCAGG